MAYERTSETRIKGDSFDVFVDNTMKLFESQLSIRNVEDENNFNRMIVERNLTLQDQLDYRKEQLKRVSDDPTERKKIRAEITTLNERVIQQKFSEEYLGKVAAVSSGITSIDSVINWLNDQLVSAKSPDVRLAIGKALDQKEADKFTLTKALLQNQTDYALKDKTESIINTQLDRITTEKNKALLAGNPTLASSYDLHIQSLQKALSENSIDKDIKNFAVATVTGYASATALLDSYNNKISSSPSTGPVKIGEVTYVSSQEFWKFKRDSFLADNSESGFFSRFNYEKNTEIKVKNSQNGLMTDDIKRISTEYDSLLARPELANYQFRVNSTKQDSIQTGVDFLASSVVDRFNTDYDLSSATAKLNSLKGMGANVDEAFSKVISNAAALKSSQVASTLETAKQFLDPNNPNYNPNITIEQAVNKAISMGAGGLLSPSQALTKPVGKIAEETATATFGGSFAPETRTTVPAATLPVTTPPPVVPSPVQQNQTSATPASTAPTPTTLFSKPLDLGATDSSVKELQKFLNAQGYKVAESGSGAPGFETDYFGPLTQKALQKFQAAQGIVSSGDAISTGYGRLGPQTLSAINKLLGVK